MAKHKATPKAPKGHKKGKGKGAPPPAPKWPPMPQGLNPLIPSPGMVLTLHLNETPAGSGKRNWTIFRVGKKFVSMLYWPLLHVWRVPVTTWTQWPARAISIPEVNKKGLAKTIREHADNWENKRWNFPGKDVAAAVKALRSAS